MANFQLQIKKWFLNKATSCFSLFGINIIAGLMLALLWWSFEHGFIPLSVPLLPLIFWGGLFLSIGFGFSLAMWPRMAVIAIVIEGFLSLVNHLKIEALSFPLTSLDIDYTIRSPFEFLSAIGLKEFYQFTLVSLLGFFLLAGLLLLFRNRRSIFSLSIPRITLVSLSILCFIQFYQSFGLYLTNNQRSIFRGMNTWEPSGLSKISRRLGSLAFLSFGNGLEHEEFKTYSSSVAGWRALAASRNENAIRSYLPTQTTTLQPNIVFILAESTFNPNTAFQLTNSVTSPIFDGYPGGFAGQTRVSVIGGGTWTTEFETITGMQTKLFGLQGRYAPITLSPRLKNSFVTYLKKKKYFTVAYFPANGNFYSARKAYKNYGFSLFLDARDLKLPNSWLQFSDDMMAKIVVKQLPPSDREPFFAYVVLLENHSPHPCRNFSKENQLETYFSKEVEWDKSCQLNEYLRRLRSTESAIAAVIAKLKEDEQKTGRPYVIAIFGDHQPHTFVAPRFEKNRTSISPFETSYSIVKSPTIQLLNIQPPFHISLIPTWISTLLATHHEDLYLPENFFLYEQCGDTSNVLSCKYLGLLREAYFRDLMK
ncbi:hypothetical protein EBQ74_05555 [bacterium]|nr:hypothetical protein [bacterium]